MLGVLLLSIATVAGVTSFQGSARADVEGLVSWRLAWTRRNVNAPVCATAQAWEVELIDPAPQEIVCGQKDGLTGTDAT